MVLLEGKKVVENKEKELLDLSNNLINKAGKRPCIAILSLKLDDAGKTYVEKIKKNCDKFNIDVNYFDLNSEDEFLNKFSEVSKEENISGIMFQEPLDNNLKKLLENVDCLVDVEGVTSKNLGKVVLNLEDKIVPCTAKAVMEILKFYNIDIKSKKVVMIGRSAIVGKPLAFELLSNDATVTICHSKTADLMQETMKADIVISAIGKANYIGSQYIKQDAILIDVGINFVDGKIVGDFDYESVKDKASMITPVPGGVGIVTNYCLIENILKTFKMQNDLGEDK